MTGLAGLRHPLALAAVTAASTWVAMLSWRGFAVAWGDYLSPLLLVALVVALSGAGLRWARIPRWTGFLAQFAIVAVLVWLLLGGSFLHPIGSWHELTAAYSRGVASAQKYAPPVPSSVPGIHPVLIVAGAAALLVVDLCAGWLRRVPLAGLPLLAVYCVPVSLIGQGASWVVFLFTAAGFLLMLFLQEGEHIARWGRPLGTAVDSDPSGFSLSTGASRANAGAVGGIALVLAVILPVFIPTLDLGTFGFGHGGGNGPIKIVNPMTDLRRDLVRGKDLALVNVSTRDPRPDYLRISVLGKYDGTQWTAGDRQVPTDQLADGAVPLEKGYDTATPGNEYTYSLSGTQNFKSLWLPTYFPALRVTASGDWRYDTDTMDFIAGSSGLDTAGAQWTTQSIRPRYSSYDMSKSLNAPSAIEGPYTALPSGLSPIVTDLAESVTVHQHTKFEKAVALQRWFRSTGGFHYDLRTSAGNGEDALVQFLEQGGDGRRGYCEQFASAFAVMARILEIPARVAVGFLEPSQVGADSWQFSSHDLHAWPELYFEGSGWVRFEPTPGQRATSVPGYTVGAVRKPSARATQKGGGKIQGDPSATASTPPNQRDQQQPGGHQTATGFSWARVLVSLLVLVLLLGLLLVPRAVRRSRRERRLADGAEAVWAELRDQAVDLGIPWPPGRSPRAGAHHLVHYFGATPAEGVSAVRPVRGRGQAPEAEDALDRIVAALEVLRYARSGADSAGSLREDGLRCEAALGHGSTRAARRRAEWLPASLWRRPVAPDQPGDDDAATLVSASGVVDHVG
ncbi:MAG: transglutaminaseTgpA domain-containing protein [Nocardioides sp.]